MLNPLLIWYIACVLSAILCVSACHVPYKPLRGMLSIFAALLPIAGFVSANRELAAWAVPAILISLTVFINPLRLLLARYPEERRSRQTANDAVGLLWAASGLFAVLLTVRVFDLNYYSILSSLMALSAVLLSGLLVRSLLRLRSWRYTHQRSEESLPTVTLAIPARNEDHALTAGLEAATASKFPKLEILVLDDCSQDNTAQIIRSFAHDGVRFVQGEQPDDTWLGKNYALNLLAEQASGEIIIFSGVDVLYGADSVRHLVETMQSNKLSMLSVLPRREHFDLTATLLQPLRYLKTLLLSSKSRPAVLSTCWAIRASELKRAGGFQSAKNSVVPEAALASKFEREDKYQFLIAGKQLSITTRKRFSSQLDTAVRTLYPRLKRSLTQYLLWNLLVIWAGIMPFMVLAVYGAKGIAGVSALISVVCLLVINTALMIRVRPYSWWLSVLQLPIAIVLELAVTLWSLYKYEFDDVKWKGRNICVPVYNPAQDL